MTKFLRNLCAVVGIYALYGFSPASAVCPCINPAWINPGAMCTMQYDPVTGCDDVVYGNDCDAASAGVTSWTDSSGAESTLIMYGVMDCWCTGVTAVHIWEECNDAWEQWEMCTCCPIVQQGDVNADGQVNVTDVVAMVEMILSGVYIGDCATVGGDYDNDDDIDVSDVVAAVYFILGM